MAAEDQLREEELDAFTIQSVLQRAGLSVGAFYSRFPDKTALLHEMQGRVHKRIDSQILADLAAQAEIATSLEEAVHRGFGTLIRHVLSERRVFRAFMMISVFDPHMRQQGERFNLERKRAIAELLAPYREEIGHSDPDLAIDSAYAIYSSTMRGRLVYYGSASELQFGVTDEVLFGDLKQSLTMFLRGSAPAPSAPSEAPASKKGDRR